MSELVGMNLSELKELAERHGEKPFRGAQLAKWLYEKSTLELDAMTDLPKAFRTRLTDSGFMGGSLKLQRMQTSADQTRKYLFATRAGGMVESVLMTGGDRNSVCISTQIGCAVACSFCETGLSGFQRNLSAGEMVEQVLAIQAESALRVSHVVFMGMGEPLLNFDNTLKALQLLNTEIGIGMRHLTVSTSGVVPGIKALADADLQLTLAISLHASNDAARDALVPLNKRYKLEVLRKALLDYTERTGRRLTIEYVMLDGVNDSTAQAKQTAQWLKGLHCHVNLIPFNATLAKYRPSNAAAIQAFRDVLEKAGYPVTVRVERGADIAAACGQLRRQTEAEGLEIAPLVPRADLAKARKERALSRGKA